MKKILKGFSLLLLICFSFFYTDKVINMINEKDPLMEEIVSTKSNYDILPVNATLENDTIIPGVNGREVDIDKSYKNMKLGGIFREESLIFKDLYPSNSLKDNKDKYIIKGSITKKEVSLLVVLNNNNIDVVNKIDNITIFINHKDLTITSINKLKDKEIYTYGNNGIYNMEELISDNTLINRLANNRSNFCLVKEKNDEILKLCNKNNMYVVLPNIVGDYYNIKNSISNGSIILLDNINEIDIIIKYIKRKGYDIVTLSRLLNE